MSHITKEQRYTIEVLLSMGKTQEFIAKTINKSKSVISREINRNKDQRNSLYKSKLAQKKYEKRLKEKAKRECFTQEVKETVDKYLEIDYSPEQIRGYCKENNLACVSHERIYQYIWQDKKEGGILHTHLRRKGRKYRKRGSKKDTRGIITGRIDIDNRPKEVEEKNRFGDLEIDTIIGRNHKGAIVTINDRASGYLWTKKIKQRTSNEVYKATVELLKDYIGIIKTITGDNGKEFAEHQKIADELKVDFFFAKPYHSWERGANENLNGLIRQYIPKKTDFDTISEKYISSITDKINNRPRKRFNYKNPIFVKNELKNKIINEKSKVALET